MGRVRRPCAGGDICGLAVYSQCLEAGVLGVPNPKRDLSWAAVQASVRGQTPGVRRRSASAGWALVLTVGWVGSFTGASTSPTAIPSVSRPLRAPPGDPKGLPGATVWGGSPHLGLWHLAGTEGAEAAPPAGELCGGLGRTPPCRAVPPKAQRVLSCWGGLGRFKVTQKPPDTEPDPSRGPGQPWHLERAL